MAKATEVRQQTAAAESTPVATETVTNAVPYSKRIGFALLSKPFASKDKKRRYIGLATYQIGQTAFHATAQVTVLTSDSGRQSVELLFPQGRYGAADPIVATTKEAQESMRIFLLAQNEQARDWVKDLPNVKDLLTADLSAGSTGGADLVL